MAGEVMAGEVVVRPFTTFRFAVELRLNEDKNVLCNAAFAECDGLEMTMEPKKIQEGGNNVTQIHLAGPVSYGQLSLKRGMTSTFQLWKWFDDVVAPGGQGIRASADVLMYSSDGNTIRARFKLFNCLPVKLKAPSLNAKDGLIAIEEMQIAYERLSIHPA
jgi:phage tail-like protein